MAYNKKRDIRITFDLEKGDHSFLNHLAKINKRPLAFILREAVSFYRRKVQK